MPKHLSANTAEYANRLTIREASAYLGCSDDTIRRRIKDGTIPAVLVAGRYRLRPEDLSGLIRDAA